MNIGRVKKYQFNNKGGGDSILDIPFGISWDAYTAKGASMHALYQYLVTIGAGFGNTAYVRASGNDATALVGNILKPYATIGAAITAIGTLTSSAIAIDAGAYNVSDADAPFGLKAPNSRYSLVCEVGVTINYTGTYGMWCQSSSESGGIYGYGNFVISSSTASKVIDGKNNYAFNVASVSGVTTYEFETIRSEASTGSMNLMRVGNWGNVAVAQINVRNRAYCRTGAVITADTASSSKWTGAGTYDAVNDLGAASNYTLQITNPQRLDMYNMSMSARGSAFGNANLKLADINNTANSLIKFINVEFVCISSPVGYELIKFSGVAATMDNLLFKNCSLRSRQSTSFSTNGNSITVPSNTSLKIIDTYAERNTGGAGSITNLISTGNGLMVEPNIV